MSQLNLTLSPIGIIYTPYKEKFSVPRQPNLVQDGTGTIRLFPPYNQPEAVRGLEYFSHLWLIFQFNKVPVGKWQPTVRPPRLGGNQRIGVFASRATHRPNSLGLSKVALRSVEIQKGDVLLHLGSVDLVDETPIFDIKPYLAYADNEPNAQSSFAQQEPQKILNIEFSPQAQLIIQKCAKDYPNFKRFITEVLQQDPRPAYHYLKYPNRIYGMKLYDFNIRWQVDMNNRLVHVLEIKQN